jgi:hypothetical protein
MISYPVTVTYLNEARKPELSTTVFFNAEQANRFAVEEMKWEDTVRVQCLPLGVDVEGDFVGVAHTFS